MKLAAPIALTAVAVATAYLWWLHGGPSWYGVAVMAILVVKVALSWTYQPAQATTLRAMAVDKLNLGVAIPIYNEDPATLRASLRSLLDQTRPVQSVIVVDDGSADYAAMGEACRWAPAFLERGIRFEVIRFRENRGKREALIAALDAQPNADVLVGVDSDTVLDRDAMREAVKPLADPEVMAVTGLVLALNHDTNILTRLVDLRYANAFLFERAAYSKIGSVLCACGSLALYRASVVRRHSHDFLTQKFLGKPAIFGDDRRLTNYCLQEGKAVIQNTAIAYTAVPEKLGHYLRQQVRWNKSFFRESLWVIANMTPRKPAFWLTSVELFTWAMFTIALISALVVAPVSTGQLMAGPYLLYMALLAYARSARYFDLTGIRASTKDIVLGFAIAPLYGLMHIGLLIWLRVYALVTLRSGTWGTREHVEVTLAPSAGVASASVDDAGPTPRRPFTPVGQTSWAPVSQPAWATAA